MFKKISTTLSIIGFVSNTVFAQVQPIELHTPQPTPGEVDVGSAVSPLKKGYVAPFTGVLLSPKATAYIIAELNNKQNEIQLEINRVRLEEKSRCDYNVAEVKNVLETDKKILQAKIDANLQTMKIYEENLKKAEEAKPDAVMWGLIGAGGGIAVTILTAFAVVKATK